MRAAKNNRAAEERRLWQDYKASAQFAKTWDDVEDALAAAFRLANRAPPAEAADAFKAGTERGSWRQIERVDIEPWFKHEIGDMGDPLWMTPAELLADNRRRLLAEAIHVAALANAS